MATSSSAATVAAAVPTAGRPSKLLVSLLAALGLLAAGGGAYYFLGQQAGPAAESAKAAPEKPIFLTIEPLTVNLQSEGRGRFLHLGLALKLRDEQSRAQLVEFMPELRSRLLLLLSNRSPESLVSTEDKARLADEIRVELNRPFGADRPGEAISGVSFNTFMVQ